jgi:hypothetical protein
MIVPGSGGSGKKPFMHYFLMYQPRKIAFFQPKTNFPGFFPGAIAGPKLPMQKNFPASLPFLTMAGFP